MRPTWRQRLLRSAALPLVLSSCTEPLPPPSLTGDWTGSGAGRVIAISITDAEGDLTGTGTITNPAATLVLSGTRQGRAVTLTFLASSGSAFNLFDFTGELRGVDLEGTLGGWDFDEDPIILVR